MKALRLLGLPWMAWSKGTREILVGINALIVSTVVLGTALTHTHGVAPPPHAIHLIAAVDCVLWAFALSQTILLAREAHRMCLPTLGREALASVLLYLLLTIVMPALLLAWLGADGTVALVELALGAGLGLGYAVLPAWLGVWALIAPILVEHLPAGWLPLPTASTHGYLLWAAPCAVALWLLIAIFWRRAVRLEHGLGGGNKPILFSLRTMNWYGRDNAGNTTESQRLRRRARWQQCTADLRGSGPGHAITNLRVALGGWAIPQTPGSWLRQLATWVGALALGTAFVAVTMHDGQRHGDHFNLAWVYATITGPLLAQAHAQTLQRRWGRSNGELPLMALLPSLGEGESIKRDLLRACLLPTFTAQCLVALAVLATAGWFHLPASVWVGLALAQLAGMSMLVAFTLTTLGGRSMGFWVQKFFVFGFLLVIGIGTLIAAATHFSPTAMMSTILVFAILMAFLFVPLALIAIDGWRRFQCRPHPFLANQP